MQISNVENILKLSFGAAPTKKGLAEMDKLCVEGDFSIMEMVSTTFDMPQYSMYSNENNDTGIGKFASKETFYFLETMKPYIGFDNEKIYPIGRFTSNVCAKEGFFCPYERGSFTIGEDNIDWNMLIKEEYGNILEKKMSKNLLSKIKKQEQKKKI